MTTPNPASPPEVLFVLGMVPISTWSSSRSIMLDLERAAKNGQIAAGATRELVLRGCREAMNSQNWRLRSRAKSIMAILGEAAAGMAPASKKMFPAAEHDPASTQN